MKKKLTLTSQLPEASVVSVKTRLIRSKLLLSVEEILGLLGLDELLGEDIGSGLGRLLHADALDHALGAGLCREGCNCFLCHNSDSFTLFHGER
jgi:hypothetical protein